MFVVVIVGSYREKSEFPRIFQRTRRAYNTGKGEERTGKGLPVCSTEKKQEDKKYGKI